MLVYLPICASGPDDPEPIGAGPPRHLLEGGDAARGCAPVWGNWWDSTAIATVDERGLRTVLGQYLPEENRAEWRYGPVPPFWKEMQKHLLEKKPGRAADRRRRSDHGPAREQFEGGGGYL